MKFRFLLVLVLALGAGFSAEISVLNTESEWPVYSSFSLRMQVVDGSVPQPYPSCSVKVYRGSEQVSQGSALSFDNYAQYNVTFSYADDYVFNITCVGVSGYKTKQIEFVPNSEVGLRTEGGGSIGAVLQIYATYDDYDGDFIPGASCTLSLEYEGEAPSSYYPVQEGKEYAAYISVEKSGDVEIRVTCSKSGYSTASKTKTVSVEETPVEISVETVPSLIYFGSDVLVYFRVVPGAASCSSDKGTVSFSEYGRYSVRISPVDFIGEKTVKIMCASSGYSSSQKTFTLKSFEAPTRIDYRFSPQSPYSFQTITVVPSFIATQQNSEVEGASCVVNAGGKDYPTKSGTGVSFQAPPGPAEVNIGINCSKYGYSAVSGNFKVTVRQIQVEGTAVYPEDIRETENFSISLEFTPQVLMNCSFDGTLKDGSGITQERFQMQEQIQGKGAFSLSLPGQGTFEFDVECSLLGYSTFSHSGKIESLLFSKSEEITATLLLTVLTIIIAVGFVLVRKWM